MLKLARRDLHENLVESFPYRQEPREVHILQFLEKYALARQTLIDDNKEIVAQLEAIIGAQRGTA